MQIKCYSIVPWANQITYFDEATKKDVKIKPSIGSTVWKDAWTSILTDFMKHVEEKGWFDITYIAMDERGMSDLKEAVDLIETVKNSDDKHFKILSAMNYQSGNDYSFLDRIDDISIGLSHINHDSDDMKKMSAHRKELGLITTIYTCTGDYPSNYTISDPVDNAWVMWYSLSQNTDGFMRWAWDKVVEKKENTIKKTPNKTKVVEDTTPLGKSDDNNFTPYLIGGVGIVLGAGLLYLLKTKGREVK